MNKNAFGYIFVVSGPSAAGKSSLVARVLQKYASYRLSPVVTYTTRPPRSGEQDGVDYHFMSYDTFWQYYYKGAFIEYSCAYGACYASAWSSLAHIPPQTGKLMVIDRSGALRVMQAYSQAVGIWILPPHEDVLYRRLCQRGLSRENIAHRMDQSRIEMHREHVHPQYHYWLVNDDIQEAEYQLVSCISQYLA